MGLQKLIDAQKTVDELTADAQVKKKDLAVQQAEADAALKEITKAMSIAAERKQEAERLSTILSEENVIL